MIVIHDADNIKKYNLLTPREKEVMDCVCNGDSGRAIGKKLGITNGTARSHLKHIAKKLDTKSMLESAVIVSHAKNYLKEIAA